MTPATIHRLAYHFAERRKRSKDERLQFDVHAGESIGEGRVLLGGRYWRVAMDHGSIRAKRAKPIRESYRAAGVFIPTRGQTDEELILYVRDVVREICARICPSRPKMEAPLHALRRARKIVAAAA